MKTKQVLKIATDILMTIALLLLMSYSLVGEELHEFIGVGIFVLFIVHHILNVKWSKNIFKGKHTPHRIVQTVLTSLLIIFMSSSIISGVILSRTIFEFLNIKGDINLAQKLHMLCAYWGFILISLHLGIHWITVVNSVGRLYKTKSPVRAWTARITGWLIAVYGIYAFFKRNIFNYMFLKIHFVFFNLDEPLILFIIDYMAVMGLFVLIGYYIMRFINNKNRQKRISDRTEE